MITPTIGRIVLYCLAQHDVDAITHLREQRGDHLNPVVAGEVFPGIVVRVHNEDCINIKVQLDGDDNHWATSRSVSEEPEQGKFHWMPYQKANA